MTLQDAFKRIARGHVAVLLGCLLLGAVAGAMFNARRPSTYVASARVVFGTAVPKSEAESSGLASTVRAIVTSPAEVEAAIEGTGATRDAGDVASHVSLAALGTSNVFKVTVSDREPQVAAALANQLVRRVGETWSRSTGDSVRSLVDGLDAQVQALRAQMDTIDRSLSAPGSASGGASVDALLARRTDLARQAADLQDERSKIVADDALRPKPWTLQAATAPPHAEPSGLAKDLVLGTLLGAVAGVGVAAALETFRPRLLGARAQATILDVPVLGEYTVHGATLPADELGNLSRRLELAAQAHQLGAVALVDLSAGPHNRDEAVSLIATSLVEATSSPDDAAALDLTEEEHLPPGQGDLVVAPPNRRITSSRARSSAAGAKQVTRHRLRVLPYERALAERSRLPTGFALITPPAMAARDVARVDDLRRTTGWPLLGLVCVRTSRWSAARHRCHKVRVPRVVHQLAAIAAGSRA